MDFPAGPVVKNLPSSAGDVGSIPGRGTKIPHAAEPLSPPATTTELARLTREPACRKLQSPHSLEPVRHKREAQVLQRRPRELQLKTRHSQKIIINFKINKERTALKKKKKEKKVSSKCLKN